jgi:hypothetical protein
MNSTCVELWDSNPRPLACHQRAGHPPESVPAGHRPGACTTGRTGPGRLRYFTAVPPARLDIDDLAGDARRLDQAGDIDAVAGHHTSAALSSRLRLASAAPSRGMRSSRLMAMASPRADRAAPRRPRLLSSRAALPGRRDRSRWPGCARRAAGPRRARPAGPAAGRARAPPAPAVPRRRRRPGPWPAAATAALRWRGRAGTRTTKAPGPGTGR